ncbi:MAG: phosphoenolpyruvate synthase, partial [Prevotella sp.]|nr:phosphoenolpyruvate synthase [Prevotella sp.]
SDPRLGIPVRWAQISRTRVMIELEQPGRSIEASQGTHFFQNITSLGVGYFTIRNGNGFFRSDLLDRLPAVVETAHLRHVRLDKPLRIMLDGMKQTGVAIFGTEET